MLGKVSFLSLFCIVLAVCWDSTATAKSTRIKHAEMIDLPSPVFNSNTSLESAIKARRSVRDFSSQTPTLKQISQLLWAAQGITSLDGLRTAPSAGALYPLEIYLVAGLVDGLPAGVYRYIPDRLALERIREGDLRKSLADAALSQQSVATAPATLVITGIEHRTAVKYGQRAGRYILIEVGHAGQNILLQATALGLGSVVIGAFDDREVQNVLGLPTEHAPLSIIPVGFPAH